MCRWLDTISVAVSVHVCGGGGGRLVQRARRPVDERFLRSVCLPVNPYMGRVKSCESDE